MASVTEMLRKSAAMTKEQWAEATRRFDCGTEDRTYIAMAMVNRPDLYERKACYALGLPTEAETMTVATVQAARYAKLAFLVATVSAIATAMAVFK